MKLVLLGTTAGPRLSVPGSNPAQLIEIGTRRILVDCGEGTPHQLIRAGYPAESVESIFITHQHSDHNGAYGNVLLSAWASELGRTVRTYGPPPLRAMTDAFFDMFAYDIDTRVEDEGRTDLRQLVQVTEINHDGTVIDDGEITVRAAVVDHPPVVPSFAYRFDAGGRSVVISGDTAPCDRLVRLAEGADVLVHEVIHIDHLDARIGPNYSNAVWPKLRAHLVRSHTPVEEVGKIAAAAGVQTLVLSHFAPGGLPDETWLEPVRRSFSGEIVVGRDLLTLHV